MRSKASIYNRRRNRGRNRLIAVVAIALLLLFALLWGLYVKGGEVPQARVEEAVTPTAGAAG